MLHHRDYITLKDVYDYTYINGKTIVVTPDYDYYAENPREWCDPLFSILMHEDNNDDTFHVLNHNHRYRQDTTYDYTDEYGYTVWGDELYRLKCKHNDNVWAYIIETQLGGTVDDYIAFSLDCLGDKDLCTTTNISFEHNPNFVYCKKSDFLKRIGSNRRFVSQSMLKQAEQIAMKEQVDLYHYIKNEFYVFHVYDEIIEYDVNLHEYEFTDSCTGFYTKKDALESAISEYA